MKVRTENLSRGMFINIDPQSRSLANNGTLLFNFNMITTRIDHIIVSIDFFIIYCNPLVPVKVLSNIDIIPIPV